MNSTLRLRLIGIIMLGIPLALTAVGVSFYQYNKQVANTALMERAGEVAVTLDQLFAQVLAASSRSRSYTLSGEVQFLQEYEAAVAAIPPLVDRIRVLTAGHIEQTALLPELERTLEIKLDHQANLVRTYQVSGFGAVRELLIIDIGQRLEAFRTQVSAVRSSEYRVATHFLGEFRDGLLLQLAVILLLVLCGGIWMSMLSATAIRGILMPVRGMIDHVNRIAVNDAVPDLPVLRRDEIGALAVHINAMTQSVREANAARETARAALAAERQNLVDAVEALNEGFAAFDANELLIQSNQKYCEIYPEISAIAVHGVSLTALLTQRAEFGREADAKGRTEAWVAEKLADFRNPGHPSEHHMDDGRVIRKSEYRTRNGGTVGVYVDITQLKQAEAALRVLNAELDQRVTERTQELDVANQQLERLNLELATLIQSAPVAIMALDTTGRISTWNPAAERLTGYTEHETRALPPAMTLPEKTAAFDNLLKQVQTGQNVDNIELDFKRRDGSEFLANLSAAALLDARGALHGTIITFVDLTESRGLQNQFQQSQKMEIVAELTAGLAHDFNNLLAIVISNLDMLEQRVPKDGMAAELVSAALRASLSGVALNRQLLAFSKRQALQPMLVNVRQTVEGLIALLHPTLGEHVDCRIEIQPGLWSTIIDPTLLESAILNLAVNARDAMPKGGTLTITAANETLSDTRVGPESLSGDCVVITVADTGTGMPDEIVARAFEPFFTTKTFGKGSGLGLSMVYGFVRQSGGSISIESVPGQGTSVHIYLPRAPLDAELGDETAEDSMIVTGSGSTILVVEDNDALRLAVVRQLRELGYEVVEADSARPALRILASDATVDLLLTDIVMPGGMDGRALAQAALKLRPTLPIIFTSGFPAGSGEIPVSGMQEMGVAVLAKPVRGAELAHHIRHALEAHAVPACAAET